MIKVIIQISLIKYFTANYLSWLALELFFGFVYGFWINRQVKKHYPWLKTSITNGKNSIKNYPDLIKTTRNIIPHKLSGFILGQTDNILIFAFTSLKTVTLYTNYLMIISKVVSVVTMSISGMNSIVGNLIVSKDEKKIRSVYWIMQLFFYSCATVFIVSCYFLIEPFISVWLGSEYVLERTTLIVLLVNSYIGLVRIPNELYRNGYVIYYDTWAPYAEAILNLGCSLILGYFYGLPGVLFGTFISLFLIIFLWKPILLYRDGFKKPISEYWFKISRYLIITLLAFIVMNLFVDNLYNPEIGGFIDWILFSIVIFGLTSIVVLILSFILCKEFKDMVFFLRYKKFK